MVSPTNLLIYVNLLFCQILLLTIQKEMRENYAAYVQMTKMLHVIILILFNGHAQKHKLPSQTPY